MSQQDSKKVKYTKRQKAQWYRAAAKRLDQQKKLGVSTLGWYHREEPGVDGKCFCTLGALAWVIPQIEVSPDIYTDRYGDMYRDHDAEVTAAMHVFKPDVRTAKVILSKDVDPVVGINDSSAFEVGLFKGLGVRASKKTMATYMRTVARVLEHGGKLPGATSSQSA